jgi:N-acetylmuramoyl-L-alanine amidase
MDLETPSLFADINKEWLARCVYSENGNQGFECQVKTAKAILNRVLDEEFPNTVEDVVSSPGQFSVYSNGCMWSKEPTEETYAAIEQAIAEIEADPEMDKVLYFNNAPFTDGWCTFAYQIGDAYFYYR